jgi:hypothetical protein
VGPLNGRRDKSLVEPYQNLKGIRDVEAVTSQSQRWSWNSFVLILHFFLTSQEKVQLLMTCFWDGISPWEISFSL